MKLTRERKIFVAVLGLALAALVTDRLTSTSDSAAAAAESDRSSLLLASSSTATSSGKGPSISAPAGDELSLARRLAAAVSAAKVGDERGGRDLFRVPAKWSKEVEVNSAEAARVAAEQFARSHRLGAIAHNAGGAVAVVDGKLLHTGAVVDGFRLLNIARDSAVFQGPGGAQARLVLNIEAVR
jgi:hypothetical protein